MLKLLRMLRGTRRPRRVMTDLPFSVGDTVRFTLNYPPGVVAGDVGHVEHALDLRGFTRTGDLAHPNAPLQGVMVVVWRLRKSVSVVVYGAERTRHIKKVETAAEPEA